MLPVIMRAMHNAVMTHAAGMRHDRLKSAPTFRPMSFVAKRHLDEVEIGQ